MIGSAQATACIPTRDLATSRRFYVDTLGLEVVGEDSSGGLMLRAGGESGLYVYETEAAGYAKHTLAAFSSEHVDDDIADLRDKGIEFETYDDMPGVEWDGDVAVMGEERMRGVWFHDPDGNVLGLFQFAEVPALA